MLRVRRSVLLKLRYGRWIFATIALFSFGLVFLIIHIINRSFTNQHITITSKYISPECTCMDEDGSAYDFCYHLPENKTIRGERFSCEHLSTLKSLGLLNTSQFPFAPGNIDPMFVAAFSEDHQEEALYLMKSIAEHKPDMKRMIVYDLGGVDRSLFKKYSFLEFRTFNFGQYPSYVKNLLEYRWKPLMIAEALTEFKSIWYMDTSIVFKKGDLSHVQELITCRNNVSQRPPIKSIAERDLREKTVPLESGWNVEQWKEAVAECRKPAFLMTAFTGHGIYTATSPAVYKFIPTNYKEIKKFKAKMYESGLTLVVRTNDTMEDIMKWHVLCALEEGCMAGEGLEHLSCLFGEDRYAMPPRCHRFDQSVLNVLVANLYWYDKHYYASEIVDFFVVIRR